MFFLKPRKSNSSFTSIVFIIFIAVIAGVSTSAIFQRLNNIFFYNVFLGSIFSGVISFLLFRLTSRKNNVQNVIRPYAVIISTLISFSFLSTIPLTIDRSYSVWLLKNLTEAESLGKTINKEELIKQSIGFFSAENGQLNRRIEEQVKLGNLQIVDKGTIEVSMKGIALAKMHNLIGIIFGLEPKYSRLKT
jgi:hypothetical protein